MSLSYQAVGWNRQKKIYDLTIFAGVMLYLGLFVGVGAVVRPETTIETLLIRAFGTAAFLMLHVILSIGPLCRLDPRFLPLLYNRRHLGVSMFVMAAAHSVFAIFQFHAGQDQQGGVMHSRFVLMERCGTGRGIIVEPAGAGNSPRSNQRKSATSTSSYSGDARTAWRRIGRCPAPMITRIRSSSRAVIRCRLAKIRRLRLYQRVRESTPGYSSATPTSNPPTR